MAPKAFLAKLVQTISSIKTPAIIIIFVVALLQASSAVFIGGQDKRALFSTIIGLIVMAALIFYADKFILYLSRM